METRENTLDDFVIKEMPQYRKRIILTKDDIWLDAGGNIGAFSNEFNEEVKQIISFEPDKENFELMVRNTKDLKNVINNNLALVGNNDKERSFFLNVKRNKGTHSFLVKRGRDKVTVNCVNINEVIKKYNINKIKMDVEGAEYELIKVINFTNITEIVLEFHFSMLKDKDHSKFDEIIEILESNFNKVIRKEKIGGDWTTLINCLK